MNASSAPSLFANTDPHADRARTFVNPCLWFVDCDGYRVIFCRHEILYRVALDDSLHMALVAVTLRQSELATQIDIAKAFGHSVASQRRWETRYAQDGSAGLQPKTPTGRPAKLDRGQRAFVHRWFQQGVSNLEMARRLAVSEATNRRELKQADLRRQATAEPELPLVDDAATAAEASTAAPPVSASAPVVRTDESPLQAVPAGQ